MRKFIFISSFFIPLVLKAQNCEAFLFFKDTLQYEACKLAEKRAGHYQFSREYQEALDEAIEKCDYFSDAYRHKSVSYLKSGDFLSWKKLMDKAVELDPVEHLGYRGWCRYQFFRDYQGAIQDIEQLDKLIDYNIGFSVNGDYHLHIARAICYKALGQKEKAIQIILAQLADENHIVGLYDYLHLGVLYLETDQPEKAKAALQRQSEENELAESQFYLAFVFKKMGQEKTYRDCLQKAKALYVEGKKMFDSYNSPMDKIYLQQIEAALKKNKLG